MARSGPEYSRIIASCTIVSSRWVDGLSTGSRPVSAMITTISATAASRLDRGEHLRRVVQRAR